MNNDPVYCWESDGCGWIRVAGAAFFGNATVVKELAKAAIERGVRDFVVDLAECTELDSTFVGMIAGIALRLRDLDRWRGTLRVVHASSEQEKLFRGLGLEQLIMISG
jgi:hypothetical protein